MGIEYLRSPKDSFRRTPDGGTSNSEYGHEQREI